jgi:hypothetical protein
MSTFDHKVVEAFIQTMEGNGAGLATQPKTTPTTPPCRDYRCLPEVIGHCAASDATPRTSCPAQPLTLTAASTVARSLFSS